MDPELDIKDAGKMVDDGCSAPNQITSKDVDSRLVRLDPFGLPLKPTPTEDPLDPLNWSKPKRYFVIFLACFGGFLTLYVTTNTVQGFFLLMDLYDATYSEVNWTIAVSSLGILAAILLLSSLAEVYGRRKVMILPLPEISTGPHYRCHVIVGFNIISDLSWEHEVGLHAGLLVIAVDLGFTLGAIFSGFTASAGPYWAQYHVVIMYGILAALCFFFLPETLYPRHTILEMIQNGETLENLTRTKQIKPWTLIRIPGFQHDPVYQTPISFIKGFSRYRLLIVCFAFSFFQYSWVTAFLSMAPAANAAFDIRVQGLLFIGFALGILIAEVFCSGRLSDIICSKIALKEGGERRPEMRLYLGYPAVAVNAVGLCVWGLSAQYQWHWMAGQVGMFLSSWHGPPQTGNGAVCAYIFDCYPDLIVEVMAFYAIFLNAASFVVPFYINLIAALLRLQPMRWTSHMEESLQHLLHQPETLGDEVLVAIAEISKITDDITMAFPLQPVNLQATGQPLTPPTLYVKSLLMRVEATKKVLRQELSDNEVIQSYLYNATMMINSLPIANTFCAESLPGVADFGKTDCIFACIDAIKKGLDNWLAVADKDRWGMTVAPLLQFGRCCHTLYRVYMTEDPAWDRFRVRNAVDVIQILEQGAQAMEAVPRAVGLQGDGDDFFSRSAMALRSTILIWKKAFVDSEASAGFGHGAQLVAAPTQPSVSDLDFMQMDFSHDGWLEEIFTCAPKVSHYRGRVGGLANDQL
ncbi:hypothetical protein ACJ41O_005727 [Fusarium nematophilum]